MRKWLIPAVIILASTHAHAQNCRDVKFGDQAPRPPQNASRDIIGQSLDEIKDRGWMLFAVYEDFPPFSFREDGKQAGIDIDVAKLIAEFIGVEARFNVVAADENVDADLRNNVWKGPLINGRVSNVMMHIPYDRELGCRNELVVLSGQYFNDKIVIAYSDDYYKDSDPPVPAYFRYDKVGVENDSLADFYLSGLVGGQIIPNMVRYRTTEEAMEALANGDVAAVMGRASQLYHHAQDQAVSVHEPPLVGLSRGQWTLGTAVRHSWRPLGYSVDDAIRAAVDSGEIAAVFDKYGVPYKPPVW